MSPVHATIRRRPSERQKLLNLLIQSAAADIVPRLIAANIILYQQANATEEIILDILWRAFDVAETQS